MKDTIMAFQYKYLSRGDLNYAGKGKKHIYDASSTGANEAIAAINTAGYFNDAANDLDVDDEIHVIATDGHFIAYVNANNRDNDAGTGSVDITDGLQITATDSD